MNLKLFLSLLFFEHGQLNYYLILQPEIFCVHIIKFLFDGVSQIFNLGLTFCFMSKNG